MRSTYLTTLKTAVLAATILLFGAGLSFGQSVALTAAPSQLTMPDGSTVPMWGYTCGAATGTGVSCSPLRPGSAGDWSPVVITVPAGTATFTINLTNNLSFAAGTGTNTVPTSLSIVGQIGGGLGTTATSTPSPDHSAAQQVTWPIANPGTNVGTPPVQGNRVQSFSTEVAAGATGASTWNNLRPGTYLIESGTHPSIQGPMGLYGILVVTTVPTTGARGIAYSTPLINYDAEIPLLLSEIDPAQNNAVQAAVTTVGFSETMVWSGQPNGCGNPRSANYHQCYPPAVNYTPLYYLINGVAFDKSNATKSLFPVIPATGVAATGTVLVRMVNAGLRMHVPSIVGAQTGASGISGLSLIAEDGNPLPGITRVQSEVFMAAGKTYDVMVNVPSFVAPATAPPSLPIYDRELSLSGNATAHDAGMLAYIGVNGAAVPSAPVFAAAVAMADTYNSLVPGNTLTISDPGQGVIANDTNVYGVQLLAAPAAGKVTLNSNGTFTYVPNSGTTADSFTYCANGSVTGTTCSSGISATVTVGAAAIEGASGITVRPDSYTSNVSASLNIAPPGVLANDSDAAGYPLSVTPGSYAFVSGPGTLTISLDKSGSFNAQASAPGTYIFSYKAQNSQGSVSTASAQVTLNFPVATGLKVTVVDGKDKTTAIGDYRWVIEEDRTFYIDPLKTTNTGGTTATTVVPTFGTNFHTSYMPVVATGCVGPTGSAVACEYGQMVVDSGVPCVSPNNPVGCSATAGQHLNAVCDIGNGVCRTDAQLETIVDPSQVHLDPTKRYYISVLPGDAANAFNNATTSACTSPTDPNCGHGMGGAPIAAGQTSVTVLVQPNPYPPSKLSVFVFEDDFPLNGEQDGGGGVDVLSPNEPGLGGFNITLFDDAGGTGDATGQMTYDMFNQPLSNSLAGTPDPANNNVDACPISKSERVGIDTTSGNFGAASPTGITSTIVTCPKYEADGTTLSPLAGQAVIANLMPGRYGVVATPAADRIARGEEWLQTNTLDGQKAHDSFLRIGEPSFFQEFGPAGYHVSIGFANPKIINARLANVCNGTDANITGTNCNNSITGKVTTERMSRTPDERLYSSGTNDSFAFTQCYVSFGDPDGEDFAFTKCNSDGTFTMSGLPDGDWRVTVFDQWNDMLVDGLSTPVRLAGGATVNMHDIAMNQWQANIYTSTFFDQNGNGVRDGNEPGLTLVATNIRFRDGSYSNFNNTDLEGNAGFNEVFPLFSWYVVETDTTRYKNTGVHVVYDAGGPADTTCTSTTAPCGSSVIAANMANTYEQVPVPGNLHIPGSVYCNNGDCTGQSIKDGPNNTAAPNSTGRIDPPWVATEGWQGYSGQNSYIEFGKAPYSAGENGGIHGEVIYASTRPFDDPTLLIHTSWTPDVPGVTMNLYQEGTAPDGTQSLTLVDTTKTSSWDDWAQGFRSDGVPNMNCPGQGRDTGTAADLFFFTLFNQPMWLDVYNNGGTPVHTIPNNSQFKCFDGMHNWNQLQPAPYDGMYQFPSIAGRDPLSGTPTGGTGSVTGTNCTICLKNPIDGTPMLPAGKYVVEMIVPPGYELVKEEDKNILIGDNFIAPSVQQFGGLGNVFILPDQAEIAASYNANNAQNPTNTLGRTTLPNSEGDTGSIETFWPCVGALRTVPDFISLFPQSGEVAPFAGAQRHLCDRKEIQLTDQASALAKFWIFTSAHVAAHFTGVITDDFTSEFDPFSPQFGEKFSPPNLPISIKDWSGTEISRVYTDQWGTYNGLNYSTWEVNPPNPTGYSPTMMVTCMNDPGPILDTRTGSATNGQMITDPLYNPQYSQFCYEIPFMPGQTQYMDTPVVPTSAFAGAGYNNPDCSYPDATPAISEVDGDGVGPWISTGGARKLTIHALGAQTVFSNAYSGPSATTAPFNQKTVTRTYDFGATKGTVIIGGTTLPASSYTWSASEIDVTIPSTFTVTNSACPIPQQLQYGGSAAQCGQLEIVRGDNGKRTVDAVTVTIGGKTPTHVAASASIQNAIDKAHPGDLIIIDPTCTTAAGAVPCTTAGATRVQSAHSELLLMWKPVRLQGVGAATSIINANTHPAGKLDDWRSRVVCLFGLAPNGTPNGYSSSCGAGWTDFKPTSNNPQIDRLPLEATVGWDATLNGNMAELLQEPTLMGALEGAGITVLAKGVTFPSNPFAADTFPTGTRLLTGGNSSRTGCGPNTANSHNPFPSNFLCNPSSIDGLGITDSSQGGGGIFVHGWGHSLQIANNRVNNNSGTLSGGINVGQGEFPPANLGGAGVTNADPGSCQSSNVTNLELPYCFDMNVNVHHNAITSNSSTGDELFSATPAGAGGISFCTGSDFYKFQNNWVCGNLSTGDGGGLGHLGFIYNGDIEHNAFLFNQSTNPTIPANGGGMIIMGAPDVDPTCGATTDQDCTPDPTTIGPSDGTGPGLVINANLIMGNAAESGSGGGIQLQAINGSDVVSFPTSSNRWNSVTLTNNIIANNVAGWDGAGVALLDALNVNIINNTIASNDSTASSGVLFDTIGAPLASSGGKNCTTSTTTSCPQVAGLVSIPNSTVLTANIKSLNVICPAGHFAGFNPVNGTCVKASYPELYNNVIWQNRSFYIGVGALGAGTVNQQNVVALYNSFTTSRVLSESSTDSTGANGVGSIITGGTGACVSGTHFWDIGVRGDTGPTNHASTVTLAPTYSVLSDLAGGYNTPALHNSTANPGVISQYCNGSRTPPEFKSLGYQVPPGISDATVPNPIFNLTPAATVDEGNNWINMSWGPLALNGPVTGTTLGNYGPAAGSPVINYIPSSASTYAAAPPSDFFGIVSRKANNAVDAGAVEFAGGTGGGGGGTGTVSITPNPLTITLPAFSVTGTGVVTLTNTQPTGGASVTVTNVAVAAASAGSGLFTWSLVIDPSGTNANTCTGTTLTPGQTCTVRVRFTSLLAARGVNRLGNITFTDNATGSPQVGQLIGHAN